MDFFYEVTKGNMRRHVGEVKFGHLLSTTGSAYEPIWPGGATRTLPTAAQAVRIKAGGLAADAAASTGAKEIVLSGLDANYEPITDTIATNGISASATTTNEYLRLDRAYVTTVGSGGVNAGSITIEQTGGTVMNVIEAGEGQTQLAAMTIPAGRKGVVVAAQLSMADSPGAGKVQRIGHVRGRVRMYDETSTNNYQSWRTVFNVSLDSSGVGAFFSHQPLSFELPPKSDMVVEVFSHDSGAQCDARLFVVLETI